jgi:Phosphatidylinositol 3- and 4-kinase
LVNINLRMFDDITILPLSKEGYYQLDVLLYKLYKHSNPGSQAYLINKLYEVPLSEVGYYLPQLLNISLQRKDSGNYETYFYDSALKDHNLAMKLYWLLHSNLEDCSPNCLGKIEKMVHSLERVIVNGQKLSKDLSFQPPHLFSINIQESDTEVHLHKRARADYFSEQHKLAYTLIKISTALINETEDLDTTLRAFMQNIDTWIKDTRFWYSQPSFSPYTKRLFRGIVLPISFYEKVDYIEQIVRIPYDEVKCFKTKSRVPYMIVIETLDINEEDTQEEEFKTSFHTPTDILETLNFNENLEIVDKNISRFEGYQDFVIRCNTEESLENYEISPTIETDSNPWGETWKETTDRIRAGSPFGHYKSWKARPIIIKAHDDLRQEQLAMQIIKKIKQIFEKENVNVYIRPYDILIISHNSGIIECIPDAISLHSLKKNTPGFKKLLGFFKAAWKYDFEEVQKNFVESMAGYSLICYILNLKDRHNGNILLDTQGHIIHIDFGFFLNSSPGGNLGFESAPFKLTKEMIDVMGGYNDEMFLYYKILLYQGLTALRKNSAELVLMLEMMRPGTHLACFGDTNKAIKDFKNRFFCDLSDQECMKKINDLVETAAENWKTVQYDNFQKRSNNIL